MASTLRHPSCEQPAPVRVARMSSSCASSSGAGGAFVMSSGCSGACQTQGKPFARCSHLGNTMVY